MKTLWSASMTIEQANGIAMTKILKNYNQSEINKEKVIEIVCLYLQANNFNHTSQDALRYINNMTGNTHVINTIKIPVDYEFTSPVKKTRKAPKPITMTVLKHYIEKRGIPLILARELLQEIKVRNILTGNLFYCLGLKNEKGGFSLRADNFAGSTTPHDITFVRGEVPKPDNVHVFRNFIDYLTVVTVLKKDRLMGDSIILNSMNLLKAATPYIKHYGYKTVYSYMSNDEIGEEAITSISNFAKHEHGLTHKPMNKIYMAFKDINQWHMRNLKYEI